MTVEELIYELEEMPREAEIRFAQQPNWPFEYTIDGILFCKGKVWLSEGSQVGYLPGEVKDELGW